MSEDFPGKGTAQGLIYLIRQVELGDPVQNPVAWLTSAHPLDRMIGKWAMEKRKLLKLKSDSIDVSADIHGPQSNQD